MSWSSDTDLGHESVLILNVSSLIPQCQCVNLNKLILIKKNVPCFRQNFEFGGNSFS